MIDIKYIREHTKEVEQGAKNKGVVVDIDHILRLDTRYRELLAKVEVLRAEKNKAGKEIAQTTALIQKKELIAQMKKVDTEEERMKPELQEVESQLRDLLFTVPNIPALDVKVGKNESENEVVRTVGEPKKFKKTPQDYLTLATALDIIDVERAAKVSGTRFGYLKGDAARLEWALLQFAVDTLTQEGFIPVIPPVLIKEQSMRGMGFLEHGGADEVYHFIKDDLYLVGTSEQSIGPMHADETFDEKDLPRRYFGYSTCFRREAGAYGKDTRGILRVHQFNKVEMVSFVRPEDGDQEHEYLLSIEEKFMQALQLPYQVVKMCTGDLGNQAARKFDIEAWIPSEKKYRETHSCSTCTDFQARRLNIKFKRQKPSGIENHKSKIINLKSEYVHMLNGTAFSMNRPIIAILENYQQEDGSIAIPDVLQKYMNGKKKIESFDVKPITNNL